jgi:ubiquinone/menaquinone biosynthesis C-methylase UbiE
MPSFRNITSSDKYDPLPHYYKPFLGSMYRKRLEIGLEMLDRDKYHKVLEIGYGSGILLKTLSTLADELDAVDVHANFAPVEEMMKKEGFKANLSQGDVFHLNFPDNIFDLVVCYSTL